MASRVEAAIGERLEARRIAVLGLTFKAETDDMRESPALDIIDELKKHKAKVAVHDPKGMEVAKDLISDVEWCEGPFEAMAGAEAAIIVTEWSDYRNMDLGRAQSALKRPVIVDLRNLFDPQEMAQQGFIYSSIGRITPEIPKR
jgi:UDPglucose 6-dehydrogenase